MENGDETMIAAMGNEGILVRSPQGYWERKPVDDATPTPIQVMGIISYREVALNISRVLAALAIVLDAISCYLGTKPD